ncbi:MAG: hypothetical protein HYV07_25995 [Deltaproteobacteria bacterium]|nr:hypothetical protein [Deltaproteobacteria bacterium]
MEVADGGGRAASVIVPGVFFGAVVFGAVSIQLPLCSPEWLAATELDARLAEDEALSHYSRIELRVDDCDRRPNSIRVILLGEAQEREGEVDLSDAPKKVRTRALALSILELAQAPWAKPEAAIAWVLGAGATVSTLPLSLSARAGIEVRLAGLRSSARAVLGWSTVKARTGVADTWLLGIELSGMAEPFEAPIAVGLALGCGLSLIRGAPTLAAQPASASLAPWMTVAARGAWTLGETPGFALDLDLDLGVVAIGAEGTEDGAAVTGLDGMFARLGLGGRIR